MPEQITRSIQLKGKNSATSIATMHITVFSRAERRKRAVLALLGFWALAVLSVPIMIAHFILVPGFLIAGLVMASRRWKTEEEADQATGTCPVCHNKIRIDLEKNGELPQWRYCPECSDPLELTALPEKISS